MAYEQDKWYEFMQLANAELLQGLRIDYTIPAIQLVFEPSFDNHIFLQLQMGEKNVSWSRRTWLKREDWPKFTDPIENLKYIGRTITPTIQRESGELDPEVLQPIIAFINAMTVKPSLAGPGIVIDGTAYALTIGTATTHATYKWHYLPEEWSDLQKLADMILEIDL